MRTKFPLLLLLLSLRSVMSATSSTAGSLTPPPQPSPAAPRQRPPPPVIDPAKRYDQSVDLGPHHQARYVTSLKTNALGLVTPRVARVIELASGMNYWDEGQWKPSREVIELTDTGAVARYGQTKVEFPANIATRGGIKVTSSDGTLLQSHVLAIGYQDPDSGRAVVLAFPKSRIGEVYPPNQVVYTNAFEGLDADVCYTWTRAGFAQDLILHSSPPPPERFGLGPQTTLEIWTEFLNPPQPNQKAPASATSNGASSDSPATTRGKTNAALSDDVLDFGAIRFGKGRAFRLEAVTNQVAAPANPVPDALSSGSWPVGKVWTNIQGRALLIERVRAIELRESLQRLPPSPPLPQYQSSVGRQLPVQQVAASGPERLQIATASPPKAGLLIDYEIATGTIDSITFETGTTYHLVDYVHANWAELQGGAVLKYANNTYLRVYYDAWKTGDGLAYCVADTDQTVGEWVRDGVPVGTHVWCSIWFNELDDTVTSHWIAEVEMRQAGTGVYLQPWSDDSYLSLQSCVFKRVGLGTGTYYSSAQVDIVDCYFCGTWLTSPYAGTYYESGTTWSSDCLGPAPVVGADSDNDGMSDGWEIHYWGNLDQTGSGDADGDGVSNLLEFFAGTDPTRSLTLKVFTVLK